MQLGHVITLEAVRSSPADRVTPAGLSEAVPVTGAAWSSSPGSPKPSPSREHAARAVRAGSRQSAHRTARGAPLTSVRPVSCLSTARDMFCTHIARGRRRASHTWPASRRVKSTKKRKWAHMYDTPCPHGPHKLL
ncbi:hypothetical protein Sfulv_47390 [Streptomyces fulvorobeus]|uniref:Uncharacterized protein n=1 Tax=Streptomyces fulvorobeus TaxID=284028 RepID=A0A7J0CBZ4_9ACTN|nr:hypothetical protein Sfulv_47390 [Streptomyces fulvorobeus]